MTKHTPTPGPLLARRVNDTDHPYSVIDPNGPIGDIIVAAFIEHEADANLFASAPDLLKALHAASGYLLNAKIDLETGAPKATAIATIEGGLKVVRAALASATGEE